MKGFWSHLNLEPNPFLDPRPEALDIQGLGFIKLGFPETLNPVRI